MNEIKIFKNDLFGEVRTMTDEHGEPWFVGKDVAEALGYSNAQKAVRNHVDEEDKGVNEMGTPGGKQPITIINSVSRDSPLTRIWTRQNGLSEYSDGAVFVIGSKLSSLICNESKSGLISIPLIIR